jgi:hypothetical protein
VITITARVIATSAVDTIVTGIMVMDIPISEITAREITTTDIRIRSTIARGRRVTGPGKVTAPTTDTDRSTVRSGLVIRVLGGNIETGRIRNEIDNTAVVVRVAVDEFQFDWRRR